MRTRVFYNLARVEERDREGEGAGDYGDREES